MSMIAKDVINLEENEQRQIIVVLKGRLGPEMIGKKGRLSCGCANSNDVFIIVLEMRGLGLVLGIIEAESAIEVIHPVWNRHPNV